MRKTGVMRMFGKTKNRFNNKKANKKLIYWGAGILLIIAVFALTAQGKALPVTVEKVEIGSVTKLIEDSAFVESENQRTVQAGISGELIRYFKEPGDPVIKGDVLAEIDATNFELAIKGLEAQKASLIATRNQAGHASSGDISKARAQIEADAISVEAALRTKEQNALLLSSGAISQEEYDRSVESWQTAVKTAEISKAAYDILVGGLTVEQKRKFNADIEVLQMQINQARISRDKYRVISPIDGVVTRKYLEAGIQVMPGDDLLEVADIHAVRFVTDLLASDAAKIKVGAKVRAFDEDAGIEVSGQVTKIEPKAFDKLSDLGIEQKRIRVEMSAENVPDVLRLGMKIDLEIIETRADGIMRVPDSAVFKMDGKSHVFRIVDGKAQLTAVETGIEGKDYYEVRSGLAVGDQFIVAPGNDVADGIRVVSEAAQ